MRGEEALAMEIGQAGALAYDLREEGIGFSFLFIFFIFLPLKVVGGVRSDKCQIRK